MKLWKLSRWLLFHMYGEINYWFWINACFFGKTSRGIFKIPFKCQTFTKSNLNVHFIPETTGHVWRRLTAKTSSLLLLITNLLRGACFHCGQKETGVTHVRSNCAIHRCQAPWRVIECVLEGIHTIQVLWKPNNTYWYHFFINSTEGSIQVKLCSEWLD